MHLLASRLCTHLTTTVPHRTRTHVRTRAVYLEKMFTSGGTSLWLRNIQLCLFAIPLQVVAIAQFDGRAVHNHGLMQGFHASTWLIVAVQVVGALCTAVVIKFAGNVLKTFATVLALLCTCAWYARAEP